MTMPAGQTETVVVPSTPAVDGDAATPAKAGLRWRAARQRQRQNRLGIALLIVLTVGALAVYVPQHRAIAATRLELVRTEAELASNRGRAAVLPQLVAAIGTLRRQVDQYKPLRGSSDIERAMHEISSINTSTLLQDYKFQTDLVRSLPMCREQPLKVTFTADFVDAMSFIQKLEAMDRLTRLRELTIQKRDGARGGEVNVTMSLSLFFDPSSEAAK
jgi:Tfp pilus assembly protein PilO